MTFKEAALKVLQEQGRPMHTKDITKIALEQGLIETGGKTPEMTMSAQLITDVNSKGKFSDFKKEGESIFGINNEKEDLPIDQEDDAIMDEIEREEKAKVDGGYIGKAGEYAVLSELLFRGYNAALMAVDTGMDVMAAKDGRSFNIQVKTRNISEAHNAFHFNLRIASFDRHNSGSTFYIFLLREKNCLDYIILPLSEIEKSIDEKYIHVVGNGKVYRITIKKRDGKIFLGNMDNDVTYYLNKWDIIK